MIISVSKLKQMINEAVQLYEFQRDIPQETSSQAGNVLKASYKLMVLCRTVIKGVKHIEDILKNNQGSASLQEADKDDDDDDDDKPQLTQHLPRYVRAKNAISIREAGIVGYNISKFIAAKTPDVDWFKDKFGDSDVMEQALELIVHMAYAAVEEFEVLLTKVNAKIKEEGGEELQREKEKVEKALRDMKEQLSTGLFTKIPGGLEALEKMVRRTKKLFAKKQEQEKNVERNEDEK